jgi:hypothetical protein
MKRVASCLVVSLLACTAAWVGCHVEVGQQEQQAVGSGTDAAVLDSIVIIPDGSGSDAGSGSGSDAGTGGGTDDAGSDGSSDDAGGSGTPLHPGEGGSLDRTSFYACAGGPASAGLEVGLPIGLALIFAVRRRRRFVAGRG